MSKNRLITARSLLLDFLELRRLSPDFSKWTEYSLLDNPPRLFRLRCLIAMFYAFGLSWHPQSFIRGQSINYKKPEYKSVLLKFSEESTNEFLNGYMEELLPDSFRLLLTYRMQLDDVLFSFSNIITASGPIISVYRKANQLNTIIQQNIADIEDVLANLISPEGKTFTIEELVREYGYPDIDMDALDEDFW